jgi:hypothetical protein
MRARSLLPQNLIDKVLSVAMSSSSVSAFPPEYLAADQGPQILSIIIVFPCVALFIVSLRLYTRFVVVRNPSYEDLAIVIALVR